MHYEIEDISISRKRVHFHVPAEQVETRLTEAFANLRKRVRLDGFRPGRAPQHILEQRFGRQIRSEVAASIVQKSWENLAPNLEVLGQPAVNQGEIAFKHPFIFTISVDVRPNLKVENYQAMDVPFPTIDVSEEAVEKNLLRRLENHKRFMQAAEDHVAVKGDRVITRLVLKEGEQELAHEEGTAILIGEEKYYPGLDDSLLGMRREEEKSLKLTIGAASSLAQIAGKELDAELKVIDIQTLTVPPLDDSSAAEMGFEGGLEAARIAMRELIRSHLEDSARTNARYWILQELVRRNEFQPPEAIVDEYQEMLVMEQRVRAAQAGRDPRTLDLGAETMRDIRSRATFAAKSNLILEAIAKSENLQVTEDDLEAMYQKLADERGQRVEAVKGYFVKEDAVGMLRDRIAENKTLDWLFESANLVSDKVEAAAEPVAEQVVEPVAEQVAEPVAEPSTENPS